MLDSSYNSLLVVCSFLVAILASYTALDMASRIATSKGLAARSWWAGGSFAMGLGIWSMHFIGMLAFRLPIELGYDPWITLLSLLIAVASSAFALWVASRKVLSPQRLACGALVMGAGVAGMHYSGMAAMRMVPGIEYDPALFALSIVIAIVVSGVALWMAFQLSRHVSHIRWLRMGAAVIMGCAIVGMHYSGMAAAQFPLGSVCGAAHFGINTDWLSLLVILVAVAVLSLALLISEARTISLTASLDEANQKLQHQALHDTLTRLPNRALLEDRIEQTIQAAARSRSRFSLFFLDLDGFKAINDAYGHSTGDLLLIKVGERLMANVRASDTIARVGGDEFVLVSPGVGTPSDVVTLAAKIVGLVSQPFWVQGLELRVSTSIGIAIYPDDGNNQHALMINADAAMYHSKDLGRNRYSFFDPSMNVNAQDQLQLMHDLRLAIDRSELLLHYQPKFNDPDGPVTGVEALIRWQHPTRGMLSPDKFIPLAEKTGLIIPMGKWVLDEACRQLRQWRDTAGADWTIAVNLSPLQFSHIELVSTVRDTLDRHLLFPGSLILEITESTAMRDVNASMVILQQLHEMGVKISIDDFGTGYSSLLYLKRLPASELKIDRGFINELMHDTEDAAIVSAIVLLGQALKLNIVAEGVETLEQQEFLTGLGCNALQGYLLGRPLPPQQFLDAALAKEEKARQRMAQ
ncbi:MAG TPA: EAL domain-containing protein [Eoetvoesiella sp.]